MISRIACVGGGPGGLLFATLVRRADPSVEVTVFERNRPEDTFGFGVVFSDATLAGIHAADPVLRDGLERHGRHWDRIEVRLKGERLHCCGQGMAAITRRTLLDLLRHRAEQVGVDLRFRTTVDGPHSLDGYDLVVAADGANSTFRSLFADRFVPEAEVATAKFVWLGTTYPFEGLTFVHEKGPHGTFAAHAYPIGNGTSTFVVETDEATWRAAGLDEFDVGQPPGRSDEKTRRYLEDLFAEQIDHHRLLTNNSRWGNFRTWRTRRWHTGNVVLLGDAAHTAHFSVGSGTKMAMEDAVALADSITAHRDDLHAALTAYEATRRPQVERIQGSARPSLSWWENFGRYHDAFEPVQFTFHFLTRSVGRAKLARSDPEFVARVERDWRAAHGGADPLHAPLRLGTVELPGRAVTLADTPDGPALLDGDGRAAVPLSAAPPSGHGTWGLWLQAPAEESSLPAAYARLAAALAGVPPAVVAVHSGTSLTRSLLAEQARLVHQVAALVVEEQQDPDRAETLLLSGRADLVGYRRGSGVAR